MGYLEDLSALSGLTGIRASTSQSTNAHYVTGTAVADSSGGSVLVDMGGTTVSGSGDQWVELPTTCEVRDGDVVQVRLLGADGTAKSMCVTGVVGGGDRTGLAAREAREDAASAVKVADAASADASQALSETRDLVTLRIDSSRGTVFKNDSTSTVLTVHCYKRGVEITTLTALRDALGDQTARIRWWVLREGDADWVSLSASDPIVGRDGFEVTLTPSDVDGKCSFKAEVVTD